MPDFVDMVQTFLLNNRDWAGPVLGLIAFGESLVFIGFFFPATAIMLLAGGFIQKGILDPWTVIIWTIVGAVLGDIVTYWVGRWVGPKLVHRWPLNRDKSAVAKARLFFRKYGFLTIFIGRFLGPLRHTTPLVAGMAKMKHSTFQIANVGSAIAWVPLMLVPGWIAAATIGDFTNLTARDWGLIGLFVVALTGLFTYIGVLLQPKRANRARKREPAPAE